MYLHENREKFEAAIKISAKYMNMSELIIEKDYYVTMILLLLSRRLPFIVFKGGTSLSKCYKVIKRFSEDIDITSDVSLTQGQKKKLKYEIAETAKELEMSISNFEDTRSRRDYNRYEITYNSIIAAGDIPFSSVVFLETSYTAVSFPTVSIPVTNYIGEVMREEAPEMIDEYHLGLFDMKVQGIERTLADKVFAICDYYLQNRIKNHSRHIYDIYKLLPLVDMDENFRKLAGEVRDVRKCSKICPSAQKDVDVPALLQTIIEKKVYKEDYQNVTMALLGEDVSYEKAVQAVEQIKTIFEYN